MYIYAISLYIEVYRICASTAVFTFACVNMVVATIAYVCTLKSNLVPKREYFLM